MAWYICTACGDDLDNTGEHVNGGCPIENPEEVDYMRQFSSGLPADDSGYGG